MSTDKLRALVTGDRGFLGRHFRAELESRGYEVTGCDIKAAWSQDCRSRFEIDRQTAIWDHFDLVVHCAAVVGGREKIDGSPLETAVNFSLDAEMFRWAAQVRPGRVIYISSSAAYPVYLQGNSRSSVSELTEYHFSGKDADQVYGTTKVVGEYLADRLQQEGVPVTLVRPFSGYGEDQDATYPFRAFVERARRQEDPFDLWCGDCVRDFIHVDDVVAGTLELADQDVKGPVNLCTGRATSFTALAEMVTKAAGYTPSEIRSDATKPAGVAHRVGNPDRLLRYYWPKVSLEAGIARCFLKEESRG